MFLEINDISTGTVVSETLNAYSINYVYSRQDGNVYHLIYVLNNGIRKIEEFTSQSDLEDRLDEIEALSGGGGTNVYTYKGSCTFENLPVSGQKAGDVWNITNDFTLDGKHYPAGTNVAWDGTGWDALTGSFTVPVISNAEIDNLFLADLEFGYSDGGAIIIANSGLDFPQANWTLNTVLSRYECSNTSLHGSISYNDLSADLTYDNIFVEDDSTDHVIFYGTTQEIVAVITANGGSLIGITVVFDIPANLFTVNGAATKARHIEFVFGDPIDGHPYPSN